MQSEGQDSISWQVAGIRRRCVIGVVQPNPIAQFYFKWMRAEPKRAASAASSLITYYPEYRLHS